MPASTASNAPCSPARTPRRCCRRPSSTPGGACATRTAGAGRAIAGELGCSRRHLTQRFGAELGLPPKALGRVLRFERAIGLLREGRDLADVAYGCGYYDQPHFNRDFRELAGTTPSDYLARALPQGAGTAG